MGTLTLLACAVLALCSTVPMHIFSASATHIASPSTRESNNPLTYTSDYEPESPSMLPQRSSGAQVHRGGTTIDVESLEPNDRKNTPLWKRRNFILLCASVSVVVVALGVCLALYFGLIDSHSLKKKLQGLWNTASMVYPFSSTSTPQPETLPSTTKDIPDVEDSFYSTSTPQPETLPTQTTKDAVSTINSFSSTSTPQPETLPTQTTKDAVSTINSFSSTSTSQPEVLPPQGVKYDIRVVEKKHVDLFWKFPNPKTNQMLLYVNITNEFSNKFPWQRNVMFKKSDMKETKRIMDIARDVLDAMLTNKKFKDSITPEKALKILPNIETLLNNRDALDKFAEKNLVQEALKTNLLTTSGSPEYDAMKNRMLYHHPDSVTHIYKNIVKYMNPKQKILTLLWLLRSAPEEFLAYIDPVFKDFDNYALRKSGIGFSIQGKVNVPNSSAMMRDIIYKIMTMLNEMSTHLLVPSDTTPSVEVEEWFLNNTLLNTQGPPTTVPISENAMHKIAKYYNNLEIYTAETIAALTFNHEVLASLIDDINKEGVGQ